MKAAYQFLGKIPCLLNFPAVQKFGPVSHIPYGKHAEIHKGGVLTIPFDAFLKQIRALLRRITAGCKQGAFFAFPQGGAFCLAVILVHAIHQPVQRRLHRRRAEPRIDRRRQYQKVAFADLIKDLLHIVADNTAKPRVIILAAPASNARLYFQVMQPDIIHLAASAL